MVPQIAIPLDVNRSGNLESAASKCFRWTTQNENLAPPLMDADLGGGPSRVNGLQRQAKLRVGSRSGGSI